MASSAMQRCGIAATARWLMASSTASGGVALPTVCGRGDKKTKKGKRFKGSYGNARPKKEKMIERIKDKVEVPRLASYPCEGGSGMRSTFPSSAASPGPASSFAAASFSASHCCSLSFILCSFEGS
ncbi:hypothetical protein Ahy_B10g105761 [Arachis hypogaea]|uniref:30S ribosomal protein n=1 Tax=Arachis hypogaea TaxID=3818 RepID=A0A444X8S6_ARAHY|nr:hypothetical protein Ahy_B10g105761 [Arachis hypogaea]